MELKAGYKQTEVGVIPEEWAVTTLASLCTSILDCHHSTPVWTNAGALVLRNQNIRNGKLDLSVPSFTDEQNFIERTRRATPTFGDLVITREAPMGQVCAIPHNLHCCLGQRMVLLRPSQAVVISKYLLYCLQSEVVQYAISMLGGTGSTVSNLRIPNLKNLWIALPHLDEQQAIAEALSDADALIESLDQLITKKRNLKQGAMQELLTGKKRLPGFSGEWEVKALAELCQMKSGEGITSDDIDEHSPFPCYGGNGLRGFTTRFTHDGSYALIGRQGALCGNIVMVKGKFFASEHAVVVTPRISTDIHWLAVVLDRMNLNQYTESSAQPGLSVSKILPMPCHVPPKDEQTAIATILSDMDAELAELQARLAKARQIKQGMMQELLTGRIRLV